MAFNRFAFAAVIAIYLLTLDGADPQVLVASALYGGCGLLLFSLILLDPGRNPLRRAAALLCDIGFLSFALHRGGEGTSVLFPIYLWVTLGNGFRFGVPWLYGAMLVSLTGFGLVIATTPFWYGQEHLSAGLFIGLLIVPLYAGTLIRKLSQETRRAEDASRAKSMFLASVSHELRTPLNAIIGLGALLRDTKLDDEQRDMAGTMDSAAKQLLSLIDDILDFSRIEAGQMPVHVEEFDLVPLLAELRAMFAAQAREKGIRLSTHLTLRGTGRLRGDPRHIKEILQNLVGNAVKFTESGSVVIAADAIAREDGSLSLRFEVTDTGIGIAPEAVSRIFDSFTQADPTIVSRFGGTGLGLAICQRLVRLLGGDIGVSSAPGAGSTFWFTLPVVNIAAEQEASFAGMRLVLLAAPRPQAGLLAARLSRLGAGVQMATTLAQAANHLSGRNEGERLALLVWPEHLGVDLDSLLPALRALDPAAETPTLLVRDEAPEPGLPEIEIRRSFQCVLPGSADAELLAAALIVARAARSTAEAARLPPTQPVAPPRSLRILLADDNRTNQKVISKILERAGHRTVVVDNGEEALDALEAGGFDLVLMDLNMPVLDGIEATKMFRFASLGRPRVPVIALTADATPEAARRAQEADMDACVLKPVQPARLLEVIERHAPERSAEPQARDVPATATEDNATTPPIADIATHPRFRPAGSLPLDEAALEELRALGGDTFVKELVADFLQDAGEVIAELRKAAAAGDVMGFRNKSHALRSSAANVGARAIYELCRFGEHAKAAEITTQGEAHAQKLHEELERVRGALGARRPEGGQIRV
ncbi:MAG TPA: ATP-binding protein [Acetobacteraceae bacterium]|nr:ATP-binding protein [Acetobacteraceae bacterium]